MGSLPSITDLETSDSSQSAKRPRNSSRAEAYVSRVRGRGYKELSRTPRSTRSAVSAQIDSRLESPKRLPREEESTFSKRKGTKSNEEVAGSETFSLRRKEPYLVYHS